MVVHVHEHDSSVRLGFQGIAGLNQYRCRLCGADYVQDERTPEQRIACGLPPVPLTDAEIYRLVRDRASEPALALVRELAESDPESGVLIGNYCRFCEAYLGGAHLPTCLWLRARKMAGLEAK